MKHLALVLAALSAIPLAARAAPPRGADSPELRRFESCTELERYLQDLALENLRRHAEGRWRGRYQRGDGRGAPLGLPTPAAPMSAPSAAAGSERGLGAPSGPSSY